jgi:LVIVD repeat
MLSRRSFLLGNLAGLVSVTPGLTCAAAWAKKAKVEPVKAGPHSLARLDWPPAIVPDRLGIADKGYCCIADEYGRLAIVDLRKPSNPKTPAKVIAELGGLGKKIVDFKVLLGRAYALVVSASESADAQYALIIVNLAPIKDPSVITTIALDRFSEATCVAASLELVCVGGTSTSGENLVVIYSAGTGKGARPDPVPLSTVTAELPVTLMDLQDRNLLVLESGTNSQLQYFGLSDARTPTTRATLKLEGDFKAMARFKDTAIVAGTSSALSAAGGTCVAKSIALEPQPRVVSEVPLEPISNVFDASAQKDRFMVFGESSSDRMLASFLYNKIKTLSKEQVVTLAKQNGGYGSHSSVALFGKNVYVASGWAGVQMLSQVGSNWTFVYNYSIPRLPASSLATWGDSVVLAGADLKLYDIQQPNKPTLSTVASLTSSVKSVVGAGSFVICLTKDSIVLRKMDKLSDTIATVKIAGQRLCFDKPQQRAYVLKEGAKKTSTLSKFQVYSNSLSADKVYEVPGIFSHASANGGSILLGGVNDISLYKLGDTAQLIGSRHFENLGVRDVVLLDDFIVIAAVDQSSKGFCLILSKDEKDLHVLGSIDLPHDAGALAASNRTAVAVGRTPDGKDLATFIDFRTPATPKVITSLPTVEAASAVTMKEQVAIVAGRGMDLISLS